MSDSNVKSVKTKIGASGCNSSDPKTERQVKAVENVKVARKSNSKSKMMGTCEKSQSVKM